MAALRRWSPAVTAGGARNCTRHPSHGRNRGWRSCLARLSARPTERNIAVTHRISPRYRRRASSREGPQRGAASASPDSSKGRTMEITSGDTAWMLTSSALVLLMTPGLALFYGGMVRAKNMLAMLMMNIVAMGVITILWIVVGASLAFSGNEAGGLIGNLKLTGLKDIGLGNEVFSAYPIPDTVYLMFQLMFAIITPALIAGAVAERMKFSAWVVFIVIWSLVVYSPMAHWVWGGGFIATDVKAVDFAGGLVVHINAGAAALALVLVLGPRAGWGRQIIRPHSLPLTILGAGLLWFGWFGFNSGSALGSNGLAGQAFMTTHVAAAVAATAWMLAEATMHGKPTTLGFASGAVAGLVAITPAAGFVNLMGAVIIGLAAGIICFLALRLKTMFKFDDSLDVIAVHLVGGILGALLLGILADAGVNELATGGMEQFGRQAISVVIAFTYSFGVTFIIAKVLDMTIGIRVTETAEREGLDLSLHEEQAYVMAD
ncbi:MAG: ammonium transporter [Dehalococcoidia bacterium]|nr:MAG: ammonium transporter [Dehalococcoidia bacterium]